MLCFLKEKYIQEKESNKDWLILIFNILKKVLKKLILKIKRKVLKEQFFPNKLLITVRESDMPS